MPSVQSTIILATALLGSLLQQAAAAPEASSKRANIEFPQCISTCMRNSGCFDAKCICKKANDGILSDIVVCMNQWCPSDITAKDLITPLQGECSLSKSAVQDAEKKGGVSDDGDDGDEASSTKPTATPKPSGKDGKDDKEEEIIMTFDLGKPQTAAAEVTTTATPAVSGTLTVPTGAATTGLLTDNDKPTPVGSLGAATSISVTPTGSLAATSNSATPSSSAGAGSSTGGPGNAAGLSGQASIVGVIIAMGLALALGF